MSVSLGWKYLVKCNFSERKYKFSLENEYRIRDRHRQKFTEVFSKYSTSSVYTAVRRLGASEHTGASAVNEQVRSHDAQCIITSLLLCNVFRGMPGFELGTTPANILSWILKAAPPGAASVAFHVYIYIISGRTLHRTLDPIEVGRRERGYRIGHRLWYLIRTSAAVTDLVIGGKRQIQLCNYIDDTIMNKLLKEIR